MKKLILLLLFIFGFLYPSLVAAISDPLSVPNNKFGIHIIDQNDLNDAARLVNSSEGSWGYVTLVIPSNDRDVRKWQEIFDRMRNLKLIPIIRLATEIDGDKWKRPEKEDALEWAKFLGQLNWVVKNRYIIIYNEPNHAKEYGGSLFPEHYAHVLVEFSRTLKEVSPDFFILPAGLDASAPNSSETMDEVTYLQKMVAAVPDVFSSIDGWTSHSYPNPGFSGSPYQSGRGTVRTYQWERDQLHALGVTTNFPVFITETGWPHREGQSYNPSFVPARTSSDYIKTAFTSVWTDSNIVAITPFLLSYLSYPFDNFSWKKLDGSGFYPQFQEIADLPKISGQPTQLISLQLGEQPIPQKLITDSDYEFILPIHNFGQTIFDQNDGYLISLEGLDSRFWSVLYSKIDPYKESPVVLKLHTPTQAQNLNLKLRISLSDQTLSEQKFVVNLVTPPSLSFHVWTGLNNHPTDTSFSLLIYNDKEEVIQKFEKVSVIDGEGKVEQLRNMVIGEKYRAVIQKPYYLPRQEILTTASLDNNLSFKPMIPLDLNLDGKFSFSDYWILIFNPLFVLQRVI